MECRVSIYNHGLSKGFFSFLRILWTIARSISFPLIRLGEDSISLLDAIISMCRFVTLCSTLSGNIVSTPTSLEMLCRSGTSTKGLIYLQLITPISQDMVKHSYMLKWESCLGNPLSQQTWQLIWQRALKSFVQG